MDPKSQDAGLASQALGATSENRDVANPNHASKHNFNNIVSSQWVYYYYIHRYIMENFHI